MTVLPVYPSDVARPAYSPCNPPEGPLEVTEPQFKSGPDPHELIEATSGSVEIHVTELVMSRTVGVVEYVPKARYCAVMPLFDTVTFPGTIWMDSSGSCAAPIVAV